MRTQGSVWGTQGSVSGQCLRRNSRLWALTSSGRVSTRLRGSWGGKCRWGSPRWRSRSSGSSGRTRQNTRMFPWRRQTFGIQTLNMRIFLWKTPKKIRIQTLSTRMFPWKRQKFGIQISNIKTVSWKTPQKIRIQTLSTRMFQWKTPRNHDSVIGPHPGVLPPQELWVSPHTEHVDIFLENPTKNRILPSGKVPRSLPCQEPGVSPHAEHGDIPLENSKKSGFSYWAQSWVSPSSGTWGRSPLMQNM